MGAFLDTLYMIWNQIVYAIANGGIADIIDIAVIAYVIYQGIVFLRESRAGQLVKGLVILFLVFVIAKWWNLVTIQWALSKAIDFIIIAAAVIFQPELRRILERVGRTKLTAGQLFDERESVQSESIDKICKAAGFMQEKKIGALIVFERETQLGEIINTGTIVDAATSVSVVNNLFFPKSPLHDGAVIVRNGRIYAAGCILPLSQLDLSSSSMGTRHRAAIGMSENSDAVVLVVSEETGTISIAEGGNITRNYNAVTAAAELRRLLLDNDDKQTKLPVVKVLKNINPFKKNQ
ncbi:MAG: diadenylate cyclase CdaA [Clostridia bacterium]|nr:diadenylate cyclase CdaA [Clostridia bacterium]